MARLQQKCANGLFRTQKHAQNHFTLRFKLQVRATNLLMVAASLTENIIGTYTTVIKLILPPMQKLLCLKICINFGTLHFKKLIRDKIFVIKHHLYK